MEKIEEIPLEKIKINSLNPRKEFDKESLKELSESIISNGLINPIQVKKVENGYELICGERRLRAHKLANIKTIKAIVKEYSSKSKEMIESLIENLHRTNLNSIEKENFITKLWETNNYKSKAELAKALGMNRTSITENLSAKKIREETNAAKTISTRTIKDTGTLDIKDKKQIFNKIESGKISGNKVRDVAKILKNSSIDVKEAYFKDTITIEQADKISKINNINLREKMILAHEHIKSIDKSIEKNLEKGKPKEIKDLIKIKEMIKNFRYYASKTQKISKHAVSNLLKCSHLIDLMDDTQLEELKYFQNLFEVNLYNILELSEHVKEKIFTVK